MQRKKKAKWLAIALTVAMLLSVVPAVGGANEVEENFGFVPNMGEASVSKVDLVNFEEVARYYTAPRTDPDPEAWRTNRIAMDAEGNAWVLNTGCDAHEYGPEEGLQGQVVRIQGDADPDEINTNDDPDDPLPFGEDEAVQVFDVGEVDDMPRAIAIDDDGDIWVGFYGGGYFQKYEYNRSNLDPVADFRIEGDITPYEAEIDEDGNLWFNSRDSTPKFGRTQGVFWFDTADPDDLNHISLNDDDEYRPYGLLIDNGDENDDVVVWATSASNELFMIKDGELEETFVIEGASTLRFMSFDGLGNIWIADSGRWSGGKDVFWFEIDTENSGTVTLEDGNTPVGIGQDAAGLMWAICRTDDEDNGFIEAINPAEKKVVGSIEVGPQPYAYGDFVVEVETGCLSVEKEWEGWEEVIGFDEGTMIPDEIDILIKGPSFEDEHPDGKSFTLKAEDEWSLEVCDLEPGDYYVHEDAEDEEWYDEWDISVSPVPVTVEAGDEPADAKVTITNTYQPGCLEINKEWITAEDTGDFIDVDKPESIDVLIEGPSYDPDGEVVTLDEDDNWSWESCYVLIPGEYTVTEVDVDDDWFVNYEVNGDVYIEAGEVDLEPGDRATVTINNYYLFMDDTFWAYSAYAYDELELRGDEKEGVVYHNNKVDGNPSNAWGWTNFINEEGTFEFYLFAGAGQNDTERGEMVGTLIVEVTEADDGTFCATVTYSVDADYEAVEYHLWVGDTKLPEVERGRDTVPTAAPGQFPYGDGAEVCGLSADGFYVAAHGVVRVAYEPVMLETATYDGYGEKFGSHVDDELTFTFSDDVFSTAERMYVHYTGLDFWFPDEGKSYYVIENNVLTLTIGPDDTYSTPRPMEGELIEGLTGLSDSLGYPVFVPDEGVEIDTE